MHRSGIKTVYGCSVIVNVSFVYKMYFYSPGLCFFIVLPRFFQIFSIFLFIFISKRHNPWDILFFIFSPVFLFSGGFSLIFLFYRPSCTFSVFYRFIWFHYNFSVFMVLIFFSRSHVFYPLFHLSGLPFSFFVNNLTFSLLSTFFISSLRFLSLIAISHHFLAFHCLSLPLPPVFILFAHVYTTFSPFQSFFAFSQLIFIFFAFSASSIVLHPLFAIFFRSSFIFSFLLMSLSPSHFSRFTSLKMFHVKHRFLRFSVFGDQWEAICFPAFRKSLSFFTSLIFKTIVFSILFLIFSVFSTFFLYFRVFHVVFRLCFLSFIKLFNYIFIFSYELNFYIRFFGFSKPFTKRILGPFFHGFLPIWKDFIP